MFYKGVFLMVTFLHVTHSNHSGTVYHGSYACHACGLSR